jgi:preprotein translocase subunit SecF
MNIVKYRNLWLWISAALTIVSLICIFSFGYRLGIDFSGGTSLEIQLEGVKNQATLQENLAASYKEATGFETAVQSSGTDRYVVKSKSITNDQKKDWLGKIAPLADKVTELQFQTVSPVIGSEAVRKTVLAVVLAIVMILLYLAYSFRRVPKPTNSWRFGVATIIALAHDVIVILGIYAVLGKFWGAEVDGMFMTAVLTLLGFSVHDTIVTFDRLRENLIRHGGDNFATKLNDSIVETITRSINTSFTVLLVLAAMVLMGGGSIFFFTLSLLIGILVGTYSSIFVASMVLLWWQEREQKSLIKS